MKLRNLLTAPQLTIAGLIVFLILAGASYLGATAMIDSLYAYRSPLENTPPQPGSALGQSATHQVVFVLIDGLRLDTSLDVQTMPVLNQLRQSAAVATMHSRPPSYSEPGYTTLFTGAWPSINDGPAMNLDYAEIPTWTQDNLFSAVNRAGGRTAISGYYWFEKLVPQQAVNDHFYTPGDDEAADRAVVNAALPWLGGNDQLVLIHIDQVDYAGHHQGGPISPAWAAAAQRADGLLGEILAKLDLSKDTVLVVSDHGHINTGGHGGIEPVVLTEPFVLAGAGVKPGQYGDVQMVDVAPTLAALLGTNLPASTQGQPLTEMLSLPASTQSALPAAIAAQQTQLVVDYTQAINQPVTAAELSFGSNVAAYQAALQKAVAARLYVERGTRWAVVGIILLLVIGLVTRVRPITLAWLFGGALLAIGLFHLRYAVLDGHTYSLSWVPGQTELVLYAAVTAGVSTLIGWLVAMLGLRAFRQGWWPAARTTLGYVLSMLTLLAIPMGLSYAINGLTITWTLPDFLSYFIGFLSMLELLISLLVGAILVGVASLVGRLVHS